jgi:hypothetical protein
MVLMAVMRLLMALMVPAPPQPAPMQQPAPQQPAPQQPAFKDPTLTPADRQKLAKQKSAAHAKGTNSAYGSQKRMVKVGLLVGMMPTIMHACPPSCMHAHHFIPAHP